MGWKSGAAAGAAAGLWGGPVGVAIGAAVGGFIGALSEENAYAFNVSFEDDGIHIVGYDKVIGWNDVLQLSPSDDGGCAVTIRGWLMFFVRCSSVGFKGHGELVDADWSDKYDFDFDDYSNENLKLLESRISDLDFSYDVATDLSELKCLAVQEGVFWGSVNYYLEIIQYVKNALLSLRGRGVKRWIDRLSDLSENMLAIIKSQIRHHAHLCQNGKVEDSDDIARIGKSLSLLGMMSDGGNYIDIDSQKRCYETYFVARCYGEDCDCIEALTRDGDGIRPLGDDAWRRERKMIACPALTDATRPDATIAAEGINVNGVMLMSAEDIENYNESEVGNQYPLVFDVGHPQNGKTYLQHPLQQNRYVDIDDYDFVMLNSKWLELQKLLEHLGAVKMTSKVSSSKMVEEKSRKKQDIGGEVNISAVGGGSCKTSHERCDSALDDLFQEMSGTIKLHPSGKPSIPDGLVFFKAESGWQQMAESVLAGRMTHACVDLVYKTETVVSSKQMRSIEAKLSSAVPGYQFGIGGSFADEFEKERRERRSLIWHYEVTFAEKTQKSVARVNKEGKGKLLSPKPAQRRMAVKPESSDNGEAMILNRAKRYAQTEDAVKSGMLTDAQKSDLEKLAAKYGVGELRLEELIDEAFV